MIKNLYIETGNSFISVTIRRYSDLNEQDCIKQAIELLKIEVEQ